MAQDKLDLILERLDRIEERMHDADLDRQVWVDLKKDIEPLTKQAFYIMLKEFGAIESGFQIEDVMSLVKKLLMNIRNLTYAVDQLQTIVELIDTAEPLLKSTMHQIIRFLGTLEQRGVFRTYEAMLDIRAKVAASFGPEDMATMGDVFVELMGIMKKATTPEMMALLHRAAEIPAALNLEECKPCGPFAMLSALNNPDTKQGLGVLMELTKALGKLKPEPGKPQ
jgi:uncharacterized protein YjgD (DUF1641 family)